MLLRGKYVLSDFVLKLYLLKFLNFFKSILLYGLIFVKYCNLYEFEICCVYYYF